MPMRYEHDHEKDVVYFAKTNFRNQMRTFGIKTDDRRRHMYVIGKTGMGKTTLLENLILSDIYAGHGCCYIDPHGETAEKLIDFIPSWRINDVVYFNPADMEYPMGFNILESVDERLRHLVASGMMGVFKKIWENVWSARMEYILNNTILALLETPGSTLLGINRMFSDKEFRRQTVANVTDPIIKQFWIKEYEAYETKFATEAVAPIQNKVGQFLSTSLVRNIVAQSKSTINTRKFMDNQMIFIVNLSKGRIGEDAMRLLGGMLITKIQMSAMERVDMPESERNDFYLYVDEFQNFANESFAGILSEARKYRLNLVVAHQYIAQLAEEVRDAVFGNIGTLVSFRVGSPDAVFMEAEFMPRFLPEDIINLGKAQIYLKLMIDGITSSPFSAVTLPPIGARTSSAAKVIEQSRERYAVGKAGIEAHVSKWSGFGEDVDIESMYKEVKQKKDDAKKARFSHEYECNRCKKLFSIPVELDRSRPIYCEECKPIVEAERKSGRGGSGGGSRGGRNDRPAPSKLAPPPRVRDGELVTKPVVGELSLDALKPKPLAAPTASAPAAAPASVSTTPIAPAPVSSPPPASGVLPRPLPAGRPGTPVSSSQTSSAAGGPPGRVTPPAGATAPTTQADGAQRNRKRRRRGGRGRGSESERPATITIVRDPAPVSKPAPSPVAAITPVTKPVAPSPVMPGERITFDP